MRHISILSNLLVKQTRFLCHSTYKLPEIIMKRHGDEPVADVPEKAAKQDLSSVEVVNKSVTGDDNPVWKAKSKKFAMCLSYCGKGYFGMQRNPGVKTIEEDLLQAMLTAGLITQEHFSDVHTFQFQRAARTDKGVSAVQQVLSLKLPTTLGSNEQLIEKINKHLVEQIRVMGLKRVTRGFNSKNSCDSRSYLYIAPTFAFAPSGVVADEKYRIPAERVKELNDLLTLYKGCHNFHNFTSGRKAEDPSSMRYIYECEAGSPVLLDDMEYVQIRLKGQSFVLHQIRKMVGLAIAVMRGYTTVDTIKRAWGPEKLDIPIAPALGLMLEKVHYSQYDKRYGGDGTHELIKWDEKADIIEEFKKKYILSHVVETEKAEESMLSWMSMLEMHSYDVRVDEPVLNNRHLEHEARHDDSGDDDGDVNDDDADGVSREKRQNDALELLGVEKAAC